MDTPAEGVSILPLVLAALVGLGASVGLVVWRLMPVLAGRVRPGDAAERRREKWNTHLVPYLGRHMRGRALVAEIQTVQPLEPRPGPMGDSATPTTIAVWTLTRTLVPDVGLIALARPVPVRRRPGPIARLRRLPEAFDVVPGDVLGVVPAERLRAILGENAARQDLFGHTVWIHVWSPESDLEAVVEHLIPLPEFLRGHRWQPPTAPADDA